MPRYTITLDVLVNDETGSVQGVQIVREAEGPTVLVDTLDRDGFFTIVDAPAPVSWLDDEPVSWLDDPFGCTCHPTER